MVGILGSEVPVKLFEVIVRNTTIDRRTVIEYPTRSHDSGGNKITSKFNIPRTHIGKIKFNK